jgi:hypothetical protein
MGMTKLQLGALAAVTAAGVTGYVVQAETNTALRRDIAAAQVAPSAVDTLRADNQRLAAAATEVEVLRGDDAELKRLGQQVDEVRQEQALRARQARQAQNAEPGRAEVLPRAQEMDKTATAEVDRISREGNQLVEEFKALQAGLQDPALTDAQRAMRQRAADAKLEAIKAKQVAIQALIQKSGGQLTSRKQEEAPR